MLLLKKSKILRYEFIEKRIIYYKSILKYIDLHRIDVLYIRYPLSDPFFIRFLKRCKKRGVKIFLEIATYPYDKELGRITLKVDKFWRRYLYKYVDKLITYSKDNMIYGISTICIENGIDISKLKPVNRKKQDNIINLIALGTITRFQGYDRVIEGMHEFYNRQRDSDIRVNFIIIGDGEEKKFLSDLVNKYNLEEYVKFRGYKFGKELDDEFNFADIGVSSLGLHRKDIYQASPLKSREYWGRGLPLIKSYEDWVMDKAIGNYVLNIASDDSPVNIYDIIKFYNELSKIDNIREELIALARENISWDVQLQPVIIEMKQ